MDKCDEADLFALELLMPYKAFAKWLLRVKETDLDYDDMLYTMGKLFGVEPKRIEQRLQMLDLRY